MSSQAWGVTSDIPVLAPWGVSADATAHTHGGSGGTLGMRRSGPSDVAAWQQGRWLACEGWLRRSPDEAALVAADAESNTEEAMRPSRQTTLVRVVSTAVLCALVDQGRQAGWGRVPDDTWCEGLDPEGWHVLTPVIVHDDADPFAEAAVRGPAHVRCLVYAKTREQAEPQVTMLDVDVDRLRELPTVPEASPAAR